MVFFHIVSAGDYKKDHKLTGIGCVPADQRGPQRQRGTTPFRPHPRESRSPVLPLAAVRNVCVEKDRGPVQSPGEDTLFFQQPASTQTGPPPLSPRAEIVP